MVIPFEEQFAPIAGSFTYFVCPVIRENVDLIYIQGGASGMGGSGGCIIHEVSVVCLHVENSFARLIAVLTRSFQLSMFCILDFWKKIDFLVNRCLSSCSTCVGVIKS